jgi:hypothetical protein
MNDELEGMWKEVIAEYIKYYSSVCVEEQRKIMEIQVWITNVRGKT